MSKISGRRLSNRVAYKKLYIITDLLRLHNHDRVGVEDTKTQKKHKNDNPKIHQFRLLKMKSTGRVKITSALYDRPLVFKDFVIFSQTSVFFLEKVITCETFL